MSTPPSSAPSPDDNDAAADVADADAVAAASPLTPAAELARIATYRPDLHAVLAAKMVSVVPVVNNATNLALFNLVGCFFTL